MRRSSTPRFAGQNADRAALAKALTGEPGDALAQALVKRQAAQNVPPLVAEHTKRLVRILARQGIASMPAAQSETEVRRAAQIKKTCTSGFGPKTEEF